MMASPPRKSGHFFISSGNNAYASALPCAEKRADDFRAANTALSMTSFFATSTTYAPTALLLRACLHCYIIMVEWRVLLFFTRDHTKRSRHHDSTSFNTLNAARAGLTPAAPRRHDSRRPKTFRREMKRGEHHDAKRSGSRWCITSPAVNVHTGALASSIKIMSPSA